MIIFSEKIREHLRTMGEVVVFRVQKYEDIGNDILIDENGKPLYNVYIAIEKEGVKLEELGMYIENSGFNNIKEWTNEIKQTQKYDETIKGFLYYVALKNDKKP